jgi:hypothetical protein
MLKKIKAFFTAKLFLTKGEIITQGMLYQLEKENADLRATVGGHKASFTKQDKKCAKCPLNQHAGDHNVEKYYPENEVDSIGE